MKLNFDQYGDDPSKKLLIILHGLYGSASNFRGLAKIYAADFNVYCLDLRNHGSSPHSDQMSYPLMAADVIEFMDDQNLEKAHILGHSMGGKTAMQIALHFPDRVDKLVVGDIAPVVYPHHHERIFEGLQAIPLDQISSRGEADKILSQYVDEAGVRLFLLTNLVRNDEGIFQWRINLPVLIREYEHISAAPDGTPFDGETLFIRGDRSDYVSDDYVPEILALFPNAKIETIDHCGHWLHSEKPKEFSKLLLDFLK
ncbi:MAG: alpha/beta fold hydrolase [Alphaproteobacteria bacterium]|nr:alpha/beta fold hydrolase [Alphaproteobacteria bacterium]HPF47266.1 alpha/beta fold hydrolase [Emcibacteraceae bacterium]